MKRITNYMISGAMLLALSCNDDTIDLNPIGETEADFFQSEAQMQQAVFGVYQKLGFFYQWNAQAYVHRADLLPSDDLTRTGSGPFENFEALDGNNGIVGDIYQYSYELLARANTLLTKIEENGEFAYSIEPDLKEVHRGEALFLRSYVNFRLWNTFGTAPLVTERITVLEDAFPPNTTGTELLDQAVLDLREAINGLPEAWDEVNVGRATKNSARGLLQKILVFRGTVNNDNADFTEAINVFNSINSVSLMPNYIDNFDIQNENNAESLFELQAEDNVGNLNGWLPIATDDPEFAAIGEINAYYGYYIGTFVAGTTYLATPSLLNAYETGDPRLNLAFDPADENQNVRKYVSTDEEIPGANPNQLSANNTRILRYADALLLNAEAIVRTGGSLSDAIALVNQVRERARNSAETPSAVPADLTVPATADEALELIFNERRLELAAEEGHRWYDLRRRHIAGEIDLTNWDFSSPDPTFNFQPFNVYFPLPENEVIQSPNLNQNEGY